LPPLEAAIYCVVVGDWIRYVVPSAGGSVPYIRVDKIHIENFKRIASQEVTLMPLTALVGGNTSGKSSILQAAQLCVSLMQASFKRVNRAGAIEHLSTLANESVSY
jgi:predicted ATP-dependent endonuclease of OLD family